MNGLKNISKLDREKSTMALRFDQINYFLIEQTMRKQWISVYLTFEWIAFVCELFVMCVRLRLAFLVCNFSNSSQWEFLNERDKYF